MQEQYRQWLKGGLITCGLFFLVLTVIYVATLKVKAGWLLDLHDFIIGRDFVNFWAMGVASFQPDPARLYDINSYNAWLRALLEMRYFTQQWSYPPMVMLFAAPFALLPYYVALGVWVVLSIAAMLFVLAKHGKEWRVPAALLLVTPAAWIWLVCGQNSLLTAAAQIAVFLVLPKRPWVAGGLVGLLCVKPQIALLYPLYFALTRQWKAFAGAALVVVAMVAATMLIWGPELVITYLTYGIGAQHDYVVKEPPRIIAAMMPTVYMDGRLMGLAYGPAMAAQIFISVLTLGVLARHWWRAVPNPQHDMVLVAAGSILVTPYLMAYDTVFFTWAVIAAAAWLTDRRARLLLAVCLWLPILHFVLGVFWIPGSALLPGLVMWLVFQQKKRAATI